MKAIDIFNIPEIHSNIIKQFDSWNDIENFALMNISSWNLSRSISIQLPLTTNLAFKEIKALQMQTVSILKIENQNSFNFDLLCHIMKIKTLKVLFLNVDLSNRCKKHIINILITNKRSITVHVPHLQLKAYFKNLNKLKVHHNITMTPIYSDNDLIDITSSDSDDNNKDNYIDTSKIFLTRKRSSPNVYITPELVKTRVMEFKKLLKLSAINSGLTAPKKFGINSHVTNKFPSSLSLLLSKLPDNTHYEKLRGDFGGGLISLSPSPSIGEQEIDDIVNDHAIRLLNSILLGEDFWVFITHVDAFYQNHMLFDDCAIPNHDDITMEPKVILMEKNELKSKWKELIVQWGPIQLLVIGGFFGKNSDSDITPIAGSAINSKSCLKNDSFTIWSPLFTPSYQRLPRFLRDYTKRNANSLWSFTSSAVGPFAKTTPCHPLYYDNHPLRVSCKPNVTSISSLILKCICQSQVSSADLKIIKSMLFQIEHFSKNMDNLQQLQMNSSTTFSTVLELISDDQSTFKSYIDPMMILTKWESLLNGSNENTLMIIPNSDLKDMALQLFKTRIYPQIKSIQRRTFNEFKNNN
ncbi:unnamed protein product [Cunninghamella blakesleeana]